MQEGLTEARPPSKFMLDARVEALEIGMALIEVGGGSADNCTKSGMIKRQHHPRRDNVREAFAQARDLTLLAMFLIGMALISGWARAW
jgi:hypothetical protein